MRSAVVSILLSLLGFLLSSVILDQIGVSFEKMTHFTSVRSTESVVEGFSLTNSLWSRIVCPSSPASMPVSEYTCSFFVAGDYYVKAKLQESRGPSMSRQALLLWLTPRISDPDRLEAREMNFELSKSEREGDEFDIVTIKNGHLGLYVESEFDVDQEAVKALLASYIASAAEIYGEGVVWGDVERVAEVGAEILASRTDVFRLRKDRLVMVLQGTMEYIIFSLGVVAILFFVRGIALFDLAGKREEGKIMLQASSSLGGALTYLGLLGTLVGMFGTVMDLSAVDFVDEMKKIFDQTESFGSMGLAISTSIVGLAGSVIIWLLHIVRSVVAGRSLS